MPKFLSRPVRSYKAWGSSCDPVAMSSAFPQHDAYAARIAFIVELAEHLHAYGTTAQRLEAR